MAGELPQKRVFFENLDGLRFFCVLSVFLFHSFYSENKQITDHTLYHFVKSDLFGNGNLGVNFFFVLSGFLITFLLIEEKKLKGNINLPYFWIRRILRIWPLFFFCVFFGFVIMPWLKGLFGQQSTETADPLYYFTFLSNFDVLKNGLPDASMLGVLWSVSIEEQFYLIWPVLIYLVPLRRLWIFFAGVILASILFRATSGNYLEHEIHTLSCMGDLAAGALGAWLIHFSDSFRSYFVNIKSWKLIALYSLIAALYFFRDELLYMNPGIRIFDRLFIAVLFLAVILEQSYAERSLFKLGKYSTISRLGVISYGMYCLHFIAILIIITITKLLALNDHLWEVLFFETPLAFFLTIAISILSYRFFESPFLKLKKRFAFITK